MNIWLITSQFPPTVIGGIARYVSNAATMLAGAGHQVTVVAADLVDDEQTLPGGARLLRFATQGGAVVGALATPGHPTRQPSDALAFWPALSYTMADRVAAYVRRDGVLPDIVESQEYGALPYFLIQRRLSERHPLTTVPLLLHLQSPDFALTRANQEPRYRLVPYWVERMEKFCLLGADALLTASAFLRDEILRELPEIQHPPTIIPLPYPPMPVVDSNPTPGDLVYYGRLQALKGVHPLVEACTELWRAGRLFRLTLIGGDTHYAPFGMPMSRFLSSRYAPWVESGQLLIQHTVRLSDGELWERLAHAWAVIVPSLWENYPNVCIEAMGLGKLVIGSRSGGHAELIGDDGQAGLLFDWQKPGDCAAVIDQALALSEQEVVAIGERARERVRQTTSVEAVLPQRIAHYQRVIEQRQAPRLFPSVSIPGSTADADEGRPAGTTLLLVADTEPMDMAAMVTRLRESAPGASMLLIAVSGTTNPQQAGRSAIAADTHCINIADGARGIVSAIRQCDTAYVAIIAANVRLAASFLTDSARVLDCYPNAGFVYAWSRHSDGTLVPAWNAELPYLLLRNMVPPAVLVRRHALLASIAEPGDVHGTLHDIWIRMIERGYLGISLSDPLVTIEPTDRGTIVEGDQQAMIALEQRMARHSALVQRYALELISLISANGPSSRWIAPGVEVEDYQAKYEQLLTHHNALKQRLTILSPFIRLARWLRRRG